MRWRSGCKVSPRKDVRSRWRQNRAPHYVRHTVFRQAREARLKTELERTRLLLPTWPDSDPSPGNRRPADVYLPYWFAGSPVALGFATTAPQRQECLAQAAAESLAAASNYDVKKRTFLGTEAACLAAGVIFEPMVAKTSGAWSSNATQLLKAICESAAVRTGRCKNAEYQKLLQRLCVDIGRTNAKAVKRSTTSTTST